METKRHNQVMKASTQEISGITRKVVTILGVPIDSTSREQLLIWTQNLVKSSRQFFIVTPNPEIITFAQKDKGLLKILQNADISLPDGTGVVFAARAISARVSRITGRSFMVDLFEVAEKHQYKIYLFGSTDNVINRCIQRIQKEYPSISVKGSSGPQLDINAYPLTAQELKIESEVREEINAFKPDLLFIGLGCPKQEKWFDLHRGKLKVKGAMAVGGSLDYYAQVKPLPPQLFHTLGLEWLWRLFHEKSHLARVFTATVIFPLILMKDRLKADRKNI